MYSSVKSAPSYAPCIKVYSLNFGPFFFFFLSQETCVSIGKAGQGRMGRLTLWFTFLWQAAKISFFRNRMYLKINGFLPRMTLHWWFLLETQLALGVRGLQRDSSSCPDEHSRNWGYECRLSPYLALPVSVTLCLPSGS